MKKIIFLGSNAVLERYIEAAERQNQPIQGIIDSDYYGNTEMNAGIPYIDSFENLEQHPDTYKDNVFFVATNWNPLNKRDTDKRKKIIDLVNRLNLPCVNLIDPSSYVSRFAKLGKSIFIGCNSVVEPRAVISDFANIGDQVLIAHDSIVGLNTVVARCGGMHGKTGKDCYIAPHTYLYKHGGDVIMGDNATVDPALWVKRDIAENEHVTLSKNSMRVYRLVSDSDVE